ncbi:hypothetical protein UPYG_G00146850 [Umbra pygmaea]|uniref:Ig-like domain-containing protein n=1 Tax=Umbra pygmaea TaxID=75934 RepID=A0ABD0X0Y8_UMBPY
MINLRTHLFLCFTLQQLQYVLMEAKEGTVDVDSFRGKTTLVGRTSDGGCCLLINRTTIKHNGEDIYPWVDNVNKTACAFFDWIVSVEVTDTAPRPRISVSEEQKEVGNINVSCAVLHSPPSLSFSDHRVVVPESHIDKGQVFASVTFVARTKDHEKPSVLANSSCSFHAGRVICRCQAWAHPLATVLWKVDGGHLFSSSGPVWALKQKHAVTGIWAAQDTHKNMSVTCLVSNTHGHDEHLLSVVVKARPINVSISQLPTSPLEGETVTLSCLEVSYPPVISYRWYSVFGDRAFLLKGNSDSLSLSVTRDVGQVRCCAVNDMGETSSATTTVNVEYAPTILSLSFCSINKSGLRCECVVDSHPVATIIWTQWIIQAHHVYNITDPLNWRITRSVLIAPRGAAGGHVLCNSTNEHGSASIKLPFIVAETSAQRSLYYGGIGSVLPLLLCLVLLLFWRFYPTKRDDDGHVALGEVDL